MRRNKLQFGIDFELGRIRIDRGPTKTAATHTHTFFSQSQFRIFRIEESESEYMAKWKLKIAVVAMAHVSLSSHTQNSDTHARTRKPRLWDVLDRQPVMHSFFSFIFRILWSFGFWAQIGFAHQFGSDRTHCSAIERWTISSFSIHFDSIRFFFPS